MPKWNIQSKYVDSDSETLLDFEGEGNLVIEAETAEEALSIAYENGDIARYTAVAAIPEPSEP